MSIADENLLGGFLRDRRTNSTRRHSAFRSNAGERLAFGARRWHSAPM
jgi:hypothetical protein